MNFLAYYFAICICIVIKFPTGSLHVWGSVARVADGVTRVRAFSLISSARSPPSGLCEPEGSPESRTEENWIHESATGIAFTNRRVKEA